MARNRDFRRGAGAIAQRRLTQWLELQPIVAALADGASTLLFSLTTAEKALRPFTIVRTRLLVSLISDQQASSERQAAAVGMAVVSDQAEAIGITAIPTPITDMASDLWLVHQLLYNEFTFADSTGFSENGQAQYAVDSKAMRKVQDGEDVVVVAESSAAAATGGANIVVGGRVLVKLH